MPLISHFHVSANRSGRVLGRALAVAVDRAYGWVERAEERRRLRALDPRARHDLAMSAADVEREARKAFWQA